VARVALAVSNQNLNAIAQPERLTLCDMGWRRQTRILASDREIFAPV
jgi:hypothetical protein